MRIKVHFVLALMVALGVVGCATVRIPIQVTHPAEINMVPYKQIAISEINGNMGQAFSDAVKNDLVESNRFQVVDRARLNQILAELDLSQSDLADESKRVKLGKMLSASAMIAGHTEGKYDEKVTYFNSTCGEKNHEYACRVYTRAGLVKTSGSIDVIDVQTGQIIKSKSLYNSCPASTQATDALPDTIDKDSLFGTCLYRNVQAFVKAISPWTETLMVPFMKDSTIPDLEKGINRAKMGEMTEAINTFAGAVKASEGNADIKSIARAYWDLGLAYEYTWQFDKAIESFEKAYSLKPDEDYIREKAHAERLEVDRKKLLEQEK
jgi:tetratricopeptide (TPR) repeat protein